MPLSEANYLSRKSKLRQQVEEAQSAYQEVALKFEFGNATQEEVAAARGAIDALKDRIVGLDAAWSRKEAEARERREAAVAARQERALETITAALRERSEAVEEIQVAAKAMGAAWNRFSKAGNRITSAASSLPTHANDLTREMARDLGLFFTSGFHSVRPCIGTELVDAGLTLSSNDFSAPGFRGGGQAAGITDFVRGQNQRILQAVTALKSAGE